MATLAPSRTSDVRARVEDYLDDKFQTIADLREVDGLLLRVQEQQTVLKKQLDDAGNALSKANQEVQIHADALRKQAQAFQRQQKEIDERLMVITGSDISDDAVIKFESRMDEIRRLDVARKYLNLLQTVQKLRDEINQSIKSEPRAALQSYRQLRSISNDLKAAQPAAEGAAPHLVDQIDQQTTAIYQQLRSSYVKDFQKTLDKIKWPQKDLNLLGDTVSTWSDQTTLLLELQQPDLLAMNLAQPNSPGPVLLPVEVLVQPLALRFKYHFYGDRPTNRLDKPEYFLIHVLDLLDRHNAFMTQMLQPVLDSYVQANEDLETIIPDALSSFVSGLMPMVLNKCLSVLQQIVSQPQLLSHLIHELMSFDATLKASWAYNPVPSTLSEWKGLTWTILNTQNYFNIWLGVEKDFALTRYRTIRDAPESSDIDYDGVAPDQTKPTKGTIRVNDLLETVTDRYRSLISFSQKMRFLMEIQLSIFDGYHNHLHSALQAYLVSSHTAGRLLQGQSKSEAFGERALASLVKIYGSAEFLERKMSDWSDDIFFLELWDELQDRAQHSAGSRTNLGRDLNFEDVAAKTSSTIRDQGDAAMLENDSGALFDETQLTYRKLREQAEREIYRLLDANIQDAIRAFTQLDSWASLSGTTADTSALSPSAALDTLLETTTSLLGFLAKAFAKAPLRKVIKHFCSTLQKEIYDNVISRHNFSASGSLQLQRDILAIETAIDSAVKLRGVANTSMKRLNQTLTLLGLPIRSSGFTEKTDDEDGWGFEAEDTGEEEDVPNGAEEQSENHSTERVWGLFQAEKTIFRSNESARDTLSDMGLDLLSESEARNIISRRIEINS